MKKVTLVFLLGLIFFTIISCSEDESSPTESEPEEELIINELVTSLDSTSLKSQLISIDSASIIVSKSSTLGSTLKEGSIIVSDLGNGICRYVETTSTSGENIVATTRIARLDEIILKGEINYEATITPTMIKSIEILDESNRLIYKTSLENITIDFGEWFIGDNSSTGLEASIEFEPPKIKFAAEFNGGLIDLESYIQINNETNVSIFLNNNLNGDWKYEPKWARFRLGSIPTPIPFLVIIPTLKFAVGVSAGISTGLNVDFSYSTDIKAGINYKAGSISSIWEFNDEFDVELNHHSIGEIYPYFTCPKLGFYIEDVLGPFIQIQLGPKYQISESNNTWRHKLFGVVDSDWGGEIDILGVFKLSQSYNIFTKEYIVFDELLFSNNPPNVPSNPNPADGAVDVPTSTTLSWQCSDPDGDPLTYEVYFGTSSNPPKVENNLSTHSYSITGLSPGTKYYWKVLARDDGGFETMGDVWSFTTASGGSNFGTFTDPRDGRIYNTVKIGDQWWFAENLDYQTPNSKYYNDDEANYKEYGRLYPWMDAEQACPNGWHIPTKDELQVLIDYIGLGLDCGGKLKEEGTNHWNSPNTGATNEYGFSFLGAGYQFDSFFQIKEGGWCWLNAVDTTNLANFSFSVHYHHEHLSIVRHLGNGWTWINFRMSIRPIKD